MKTKLEAFTMRVPTNLHKEAGTLVQGLIERNTFKPIKRVVKINDSELRNLLKKGKTANKVLQQIADRLDQEGERIGNYQELHLTPADEKWVERQFQRLYKVSNALSLETNF